MLELQELFKLTQRQPAELFQYFDFIFNFDDDIPVSLLQKPHPLLRLQLIEQNTDFWFLVGKILKILWAFAFVYLGIIALGRL